MDDHRSAKPDPEVLDHHDDEPREVVIALLGSAALVAMILLVFALTLQLR